MENKQNKVFIHYENNEEYRVIDKCKIQINDVWVDALIYVHNKKPYDKFVRTEYEFELKFKEKK